MHISTNEFRKSSFSQHNGGCLEAGLFQKSSFSQHNGGCLEAGIFQKSTHSQPQNCLEAGIFGTEVRVADTTQAHNPHRPVLAFSPAAWQEFVNTLK